MYDINAGFRLGVVRGISYGLFGPPDRFVGAARRLGAGLIRAYLYWGQVEPEPGRYRWDVVDALIDQLHDGPPAGATIEAPEVWLTVCSSSRWATRTATDFLPPSPARDLDAYERFVHRLVRHCAGRVAYWQCDNEPSNTGLLWDGTAAEYLAQLRALRRAVRRADPDAAVVLGGCGYDVLSTTPGSPPRRFFEHVLRHGRDAFDLFDLHLYGDPGAVPEHVADARSMMRAHGYQRPVVVGEFNGPAPFEFPEAEAALAGAMTAAASDAGGRDTADLVERAGRETPERRAMAALYARAAELPPTLRMFLAGCPPELAARRDRIARRGLVTRVLPAMAAGIRRFACWNLAPEVPGAADHLQLMDLMFGRFALLDFADGALTHRYPTADTFELLARTLAGARSVAPVPVDVPTARGYRVERDGRGPVLVAWDERDQYHGEDAPPVDTRWPWPAPGVAAIDAFGAAHPATVRAGHLLLPLSPTPVFAVPA